MDVKNLGDHGQVVERYMGLQQDGLLRQQAGLLAVIRSLELLLDAGVTRETVQSMVDDSRKLLFSLHEVANTRGIHLMGYR